MKLDFLIDNLKCEKISYSNINIDYISSSSNEKHSNSLFICIKGQKYDSHDYVNDAVKNGAVAIVVERKLNINIPQIIVDNTRIAYSSISANFWNNPCKCLKIIGITGTNGKTTTSILIKNILLEAKKSVGVIGTLGYYINNECYESNLTTPDPYELHKILNHMVSEKVEYVIMEVSAHAIKLKKIYGINFMLGVLTNITQDHLDFFKDMQEYSQTKIDFLKTLPLKVVNSDDKSFLHFNNDEIISYGMRNPSDCFAIDVIMKTFNSSFIVNVLDNIIKVRVKLTGLFNVYNILASILVSILLGISPKVIARALTKIEKIEGRFNVFKIKNSYIIVDFAHTPDGLENVLKTVKKLFDKSYAVNIIFGCAGESDTDKRAKMGNIADIYCDNICITTDNPKSENVQDISNQIMSGIKNKNKVSFDFDRVGAIKTAIKQIKPKSVLIICGKGGEKVQEINGQKIEYNEIEVVEETINMQINKK